MTKEETIMTRRADDEYYPYSNGADSELIELRKKVISLQNEREKRMLREEILELKRVLGINSADPQEGK